MMPAIPNHPDRPACTSQCAYPHLSLLRTTIAAAVLVALLFRPSNLGMQERVKKGEFFFVHMILFYWPAALTTALAPRCKEGVAAVQAARRREEGPLGWTSGGGIFSGASEKR